MNRILYAIHRWISLIALLQLAVWVGTGLFFTLVPIKRVRGLHENVPPSTLAVDDGAGLLSPATVIAIAHESGQMPNVQTIELRNSGPGLVYVLKGRGAALRFAARSGARMDVDRAEAEAIARADQAGAPSVRSAQLIEREKDVPIEYRDKPLPAWRVELDDKDVGMVIWLDARTGDITARRSDLWRTYDFLWSLHIMDYRGHESFNHPLLTAAAMLAALGVISGATLWITRLRRRFLNKKKSARNPQTRTTAVSAQ